MNDHPTPACEAARAAYRARYGGAEAPVPAHWNDALALLLGHRSVRAYLPEPLPGGTLEAIVTAAQSAATSSNLQTWSVVAVEDAERRARIAAWAGNQRFIVDAPLLLVFVADLARAAGIAARRGQAAEALDYLEPALVATIDAALAAQNAVVAAEALGLGTVYVGAVRNHVTEVARELNLPPRAWPVFGLAVGKPDPARPAAVKPRLAPHVVLHRETYDAGAEAAAIADYDTRMHAFQASQGLPREDWTAKVAARFASPASLHGRDRLREALAGLGLALK
jgi:nitroreductase